VVYFAMLGGIGLHSTYSASSSRRADAMARTIGRQFNSTNNKMRGPPTWIGTLSWSVDRGVRHDLAINLGERRPTVPRVKYRMPKLQYGVGFEAARSLC